MDKAAFAYLIRMFPQTSETFIANEILRVERTGLPLRIYSYRRPLEDVQHEVVKQIRTPVTYLPDPLWKHLPILLRGAAKTLRKNPARAAKALTFVAKVSVRNRSIDGFKRYLQALYFGNELREQGIRHVHAHFAHQNTQVAMLTSMVSGIPFSFTGHAKDVYTAPHIDLREKLAAASFALTCTGANVDYFQALAAPDDRAKVHLAYHGVDLEKFTPRATAAEPSEVPLILSVGRLVEKKGYPDLLQAAAILRDRGLSFRIQIMGGGPDRKALEALRHSLGLDGIVDMPGSCSQEELVEIYRQADLFALPCQVLENGDRDGIPNVLMEAMATGLPVVSTAVSGIPELVHSGENGLLVPERDAVAFADAIEVLLKDAGLRARYGAAGRATVAASFSSDATAKQLSELFSKAVAMGAPQTAGVA